MGTPVSISDTALVFDALPALKVRYYTGSPSKGKLYVYARFYVLGKTLQLGLYCFERQQDPLSRMHFVLGQDSKRMLAVALSAKDAGVQIGKSQDVLPLAPSYFAGNDEQGWHWGALLQVPEDIVQRAGISLVQGAVFGAALFYHTEGEEAFGASYRTSSMLPFNPAAFPSFEVVRY